MNLKKILAMGGAATALGLGGRLAMLPAVVAVAKVRLGEYEPKVANLSYGRMTYVDRGEGTPVLMSHGIFGGYDQAVECATSVLPTQRYRVMSPARFGYLGSAVKAAGTPRDQAEAFVELLDHLGIDRAYVMGMSAGGTAAIRMALDFPERVKGLILFGSAPVPATQPATVPEMAGPPPFMNKDWVWWMLGPAMSVIQGLPPYTVHTMLPVGPRRQGVEIDTFTTNPDMTRHFDDYPIEELRVPVLLIHAKDDKVVAYKSVAASLHRYPTLTTAIFETGGHMLIGNETTITKAFQAFTILGSAGAKCTNM